MTNDECRMTKEVRIQNDEYPGTLFSSVFRHSSFVIRIAVLFLVCHSLFVASVAAHESPIDHVDRTLRMRVEGNRLLLTYRLRLTQRAALLQLRAMDEDNNGRVNDDERERFFDKFAIELAKQLRVARGSLRPKSAPRAAPGHHRRAAPRWRRPGRRARSGSSWPASR